MVKGNIICHAVEFRHKNHMVWTRDRLILFFISIFALLAIVLIGNASRSLYASEDEPMVQNITVRQGDTIWSLANKYGDHNQYILQRISDLREMNNMKGSSALHVGQKLIVPATGRPE